MDYLCFFFSSLFCGIKLVVKSFNERITMKVIKYNVELLVDDIIKTVSFYTDLLNFKITSSTPEENPFFVILSNGPLDLMLYSRKQFVKEIPKFKEMPLGGTFALYLGVKNIETIYKRVKNKAQVIQELYKTDYDTAEFSFEDCNGYVILVSEEK